jgi:hypothetical protein
VGSCVLCGAFGSGATGDITGATPPTRRPAVMPADGPAGCGLTSAPLSPPPPRPPPRAVLATAPLLTPCCTPCYWQLGPVSWWWRDPPCLIIWPVFAKPSYAGRPCPAAQPAFLVAVACYQRGHGHGHAPVCRGAPPLAFFWAWRTQRRAFRTPRASNSMPAYVYIIHIYIAKTATAFQQGSVCQCSHC